MAYEINEKTMDQLEVYMLHKGNPDQLLESIFQYKDSDKSSDKQKAKAFEDLADHVYVGNLKFSEIYGKPVTKDNYKEAKSSLLEAVATASSVEKSQDGISHRGVKAVSVRDGNKFQPVQRKVEKPKKPGRIKSFLHSVFGGYKKEFAEYDKKMEQYKQIERTRDLAAKSVEKMQTEVQNQDKSMIDKAIDDQKKIYDTMKANYEKNTTERDFFTKQTTTKETSDFFGNLAATTPDKRLKIGQLSRQETRLAMAQLYMLTHGYTLEQMHQNTPEMAAAKADAGDKIVQLATSGTKEELADFYVKSHDQIVNMKMPDIDYKEPIDIAARSGELREMINLSINFGQSFETAKEDIQSVIGKEQYTKLDQQVFNSNGILDPIQTMFHIYQDPNSVDFCCDAYASFSMVQQMCPAVAGMKLKDITCDRGITLAMKPESISAVERDVNDNGLYNEAKRIFATGEKAKFGPKLPKNVVKIAAPEREKEKVNLKDLQSDMKKADGQKIKEQELTKSSAKQKDQAYAKPQRHAM